MDTSSDKMAGAKKDWRDGFGLSYFLILKRQQRGICFFENSTATKIDAIVAVLTMIRVPTALLKEGIYKPTTINTCI